MPVKDEISRYIAAVHQRMGNLQKPLKVIGLYMLRSIARNFQQGGRPEKWQQSMTARLTGKRTLIQSGQLKNSIAFRAAANRLVIGTNKIYARIQQEGGTIQPRNKQFLTVPIHKAAVGRRARDFQNTFIRKGIIFQKRGKGIVPLFALKREVQIPARPFLMVQEEDARFIQERLNRWVLKGE